MKLADRCAIPLAQAWFCQSCGVINNAMVCCYCDSSDHSQRLADWLDREPIVSIPTTGVILSIVPAPRNAHSETECQE